MSLTFASFLHVGSVVGTCQHGHRIAAVLSGEAVLEAPGDRVIEDMERKLENQQNAVIFTHILTIEPFFRDSVT